MGALRKDRAGLLCDVSAGENGDTVRCIGVDDCISRGKLPSRTDSGYVNHNERQMRGKGQNGKQHHLKPAPELPDSEHLLKPNDLDIRCSPTAFIIKNNGIIQKHLPKC